MKPLTAEEILDKNCKDNNITFISAYYLKKGLSIPEQSNDDYNDFKKAILDSMEEYASQSLH